MSKQRRTKRLDENELFKQAISLLSDAVLLLDRQNKVIFINTPAPPLLGLPRQAIIGKPLHRVLKLEDPSSRRPVTRLPSLKNAPIDLLGTSGDGIFNVTAIDIQRIAGFNKLKTKAVAGLFVRPSDLTLASTPNVHQYNLGQLTMRIAHDFNNSLTSMLGNAELVQETLEVINVQENNDPETPAGHAVPINRDVIRKCLEMAAFIRKLQDYARQQPSSRQNVDLNSIITETLPISQRILGSRLTINFTAGSNLPTIIADQAQLHQLLFTLFDNCTERAGTAPSTVSVQTAADTLDEHYASTHPGARAGEHLKLIVSDKGSPLAADSLPKAFNLFKSSRTQAHGLRLATAYAIVKQMGGYIYVESSESATHFNIYFPLHEEQQPTPAAEPKRNRPNQRGRRARKRAADSPRLILIAEDQLDIQQTMVRYLSKAGYRTVLTSTGPEAWSTFQRLNSNGHRPSLVIADLGLPGLDGRTLCKKIRELSPRMPLLLTSGHVIPLDASLTKTTDGLPFVQKPFDATTLLNTIAQLLASANRP